MTNATTLMSKARIHRLETGIEGFDEVLGGGLPEFSFNLIAGAPGCGKTTLAHQMMFALATPERPAIYFTVLGEPPLKMLRYQQQFNFFDNEKVNSSIHFINLSDDTVCGNLDKVLQRITTEVESYSPGLIFVDSFRSVVLASQKDANMFIDLQQFIQQLGMLMTSWQATTFLIGEYYTDKDPNPVFTVADGLIWLSQSVQRNSVVRKMEIMKMRGQPSLPGLHTFRINEDGVHIFAPPKNQEAIFKSDVSPFDARLKMGTPGLDEMMGGGLPRGYSLLVAGPSGSGKSILASAFLIEGSRNNEASVVVGFEQLPKWSHGKVITEFIDRGLIGLVGIATSGLSVDEISRLVIAEVTRLKATRVVIDSLSGFELALAPAFREDFRESLAQMVSVIASTGVTVLMTSELEDRYTDLRFSPYGTAFLTDAIIVQRYIEVDSRLLRVIAVVKVRGSKHSNELRLFHIDENGIQIDAMVDNLEGLLGGRPTQR